MVWDTVTSANGNVCGRLIASPTGAKTTYAPLSDILLKAALTSSAPAGHLPRDGGLYGSIRESTLPQLFIIHQRSGFIIQYSFVPMYHPGFKSRQRRANTQYLSTN